MEIDPYVLSLSVLGAVMLGVAGLPLLIRELPLSVPMTFLLLGGLVGVLFPASSLPDPPNFPELTERATEFLSRASVWNIWSTGTPQRARRASPASPESQ